MKFFVVTIKFYSHLPYLESVVRKYHEFACFDGILLSNSQILAQQRHSEFQRELWEKIQTIDKNHIYDDKLYRQVRFMSTIGPNALPPDQFDRVSLR